MSTSRSFPRAAEIAGFSYMHRLRIAVCILILIFAGAVHGSVSALAADGPRAAAPQSLADKKRLLTEYVTAWEKARASRDSRLVAALGGKINELLAEIIKEEERLDSKKQGSAVIAEGMSSVRSDAGEYLAKSCPELKTLLVQLLRKSSPLKRRSKSTFSELSAHEKEELEKASIEYKTVVEIMKARCGLVSKNKTVKTERNRTKNVQRTPFSNR